MSVPVICIDGPNASGKGALSRLLAAHFGWHRLDSGVLYRAVGLLARRHALDPSDDVARLVELAAGLDLSFPDERVLLEGADVAPEIGNEEVAEWASRVAAVAPVRAALLDRQRAFRRPPGLVADGRDMGTIVFPDAAWKIFLTASPEVRARRRYEQLRQTDSGVSLCALFDAIRERDERDRERETAPLRVAPGAFHLDTSELALDEVLARALAHIRAVGGPET